MVNSRIHAIKTLIESPEVLTGPPAASVLRLDLDEGLDQLSGGQTAHGDVEDAEGERQGRGEKGKEGREQ